MGPGSWAANFRPAGGELPACPATQQQPSDEQPHLGRWPSSSYPGLKSRPSVSSLACGAASSATLNQLDFAG